MSVANIQRKDENLDYMSQAKKQVQQVANSGAKKLAPLFRPCFKLVEPRETNDCFVLGYN